MIIAVDFDGTIVPDCFPRKPTEFLPGAKETLIDLRERGHSVYLWSLRFCGSNWYGLPAKTALEFMKENGLDIPAVIGSNHPPKLAFDLFIEDKIPGGFPGWAKVREHFGLKPLYSATATAMKAIAKAKGKNLGEITPMDPVKKEESAHGADRIAEHGIVCPDCCKNVVDCRCLGEDLPRCHSCGSLYRRVDDVYDGHPPHPTCGFSGLVLARICAQCGLSLEDCDCLVTGLGGGKR
jgi:hypothetical protein